MKKIEIKKIPAEETLDLRHRVMWPDHSIEFVQLPEDNEGEHFGLFKSNVLISVVSLFIQNGEAQFRKFATETSEQGKGYGSHLLSYLMEYTLSKKIHRIWCNSRVNKSSYYKRFGLTKTEITYTKGGIEFVVLEKRI